MTDAMSAEFDTLAAWTAQVALALGQTYVIPAACRGSGSPAMLDWLIDRLGLSPGQTLLDCGAGVGGPAAYAVSQRSVRPVLVDPEAGACRAARLLFGYPVVQASAAALPIRDESFEASWSLGVLCTMTTQLALLTELRRVVRPEGRIGLLVFTAHTALTQEQRPEGNHFPTVASLEQLISAAGLRVHTWQSAADLAPASADWQLRMDIVTTELRRRFGHHRAWRLAHHQSDLIAQLLQASAVSAELLVLHRDSRSAEAQRLSQPAARGLGGATTTSVRP
jgi:cyclopropane fatty-acyl-phospholipid synthase-like methyltransferase